MHCSSDANSGGRSPVPVICQQDPSPRLRFLASLFEHAVGRGIDAVERSSQAYARM